MRLRLAVLLALLALVGLASPAVHAGELPAVVRAAVVEGADTRPSGTAFFLPFAQGSSGLGVAAVATAHNLVPEDLARAREVEFWLGRSKERVAVSSRLLAPPGRPYNAPGGTVRGDFVVFALDLKPERVRVLEPDTTLPAPKRRVQILGVPAQVPTDQDDLFGTVISASEEKIEIALDAPADLRGWGGAPVLDHGSKKVLGLLEGASTGDGTFHLIVAPIAAVTAALASPLEEGRGRPFASFASSAAPAVAHATPAPAPAPNRTPGAPPTSSQTPPQPTRTVTATSPSAAAAAAMPPGEKLLGSQSGSTELRLELERPTDGEVVGDPNGAFLAGRAVATAGDFRHFDVMIVVDTSGSTFEPSGGDVNKNGVVGTETFGGLFGMGSTDPGDSILSAEVAAAFQLLSGLDPRSTRVGLVTFAGEPEQPGLFGTAAPPPAITEEPLTTDYERIRRALGGVLARGPAGNTHMAAGADQATIELKGLQGALSQTDPKSEKIVLFLTDGQPTLPAGPGFDSINVAAVLRAAERARRAGVRFHSFALGPEALAGPVAAVELASRTGGYFTPVRNPGDIVQVVEQVRFSNVQSVTIKNLSTDQLAKQTVVNADGTFGGLVPLQAGLNRLQVTAVADDGSKADQIVQVSYVPGTASPVLPRELLAMRNKLLEQKLVELRRERTEVEIQAAEQTRKELAIEIERERAKANEAAERQRKELQLDVEKPGAATP
jgi:hypothetical protein